MFMNLILFEMQKGNPEIKRFESERLIREPVR